jgi:hypothetical protein
LRQMIFGGTTRYILSNAQLPVLMAHWPLWRTRHAAYHLSMTANSLRWQAQGRKIGSYNRSSGETASLDRFLVICFPSTDRCDGSESDRRLQ